MAKTERGASRTTYVRSATVERMTAWDVRDFVKALDEAAVPDKTEVDAEHHHTTRQLTRLYVRFSEDIDGWPQEGQ